MRNVVVAACGIALALVAPLPAAAQIVGSGGEAMPPPAEGFDHLSLGTPRAGPGEAIRRDKFDEAIAKVFASADADSNGTLTLAELRTVIEARKDAAIRARFASIDADRNQSVSYAEFNQWQRGLGSVVLSDAGAAAASNTVVSEDLRPSAGRGPGGQVLVGLAVPLNATMLMAADTDHDGGASLAEVMAYQGQRFDAVDGNHDTWVTEDELQHAPKR